MAKFLKILIFTSFFLLSLFYVPIVNAQDKTIDKELGVSFETSAKLYFAGFSDLFIEINIKRFFLDELEYEFLTVGKVSYDSESEMFKMAVDKTRSKLIKAPYSNSPLNLVKQYGVLKLLNGADRENDFTISLLSDNENNDPIFLAPAFLTLGVPIKMPEDAITDPTQNQVNFPNISYNNEKREAYIPLILFGNPLILEDLVKYEIIVQEGEKDFITAIFNSPNSPFRPITEYRLIEDPINNQAKILKRVKFFDRNPNYFADYSINLKLTEISGLTFTDTLNHQLTLSGNFEETPTNITFLAVNNTADIGLDRPISIFSFNATNNPEQKIAKIDNLKVKGPPLFLFWEIFPNDNTNIKLLNPSGEILYEGTETKKASFKLDDFKPGKYTLITKNSLGSKMAELEVEPPEAKLEVKTLEIIDTDEFNELDQEKVLSSKLILTDLNPTQELVIYLQGQNIPNLFSSPYNYNPNKTVLITEIEKKELYPGYLNRYIYEIRQIKGDKNDLILSFSAGSLNQNVSIDLAEKISIPQGIIKKTDLLSLFPEGTTFDRNVYFEESNESQDFLVFKKDLTRADFEEITDLKNKAKLIILWEESIVEKTNDAFLNGVNSGSGNVTLSNGNFLSASFFSNNYAMIEFKTLFILIILTFSFLSALFYFSLRRKNK